MQSGTAPSTVREQLKEKLLSKRILASNEAPAAGAETMGCSSGSREQRASQHAADGPARDQDAALQAHADKKSGETAPEEQSA